MTSPKSAYGPMNKEENKVDEHQQGVIEKYFVTRLRDPERKHDDCWFFVLDIKHDPLAQEALAAYADAAAAQGYMTLRDDLFLRLARLRVEQSEGQP